MSWWDRESVGKKHLSGKPGQRTGLILRRGKQRSTFSCLQSQVPTMPHILAKVFPITQMVKNLPAMQETQVRSLGWEDPLEKGMAIHSSILAWRIPWTEEPVGLQSMGSQSRTWLSDWHRYRWNTSTGGYTEGEPQHSFKGKEAAVNVIREPGLLWLKIIMSSIESVFHLCEGVW